MLDSNFLEHSSIVNALFFFDTLSFVIRVVFVVHVNFESMQDLVQIILILLHFVNALTKQVFHVQLLTLNLFTMTYYQVSNPKTL